MAKPILYWALARALYGERFRIIGVTSEKGRQVYGRDGADAVTHVADRDILFRFPQGTTEEYAKAASVRAQRAGEKHDSAVSRAHRAYLDANAARSEAILRAAKGLSNG